MTPELKLACELVFQEHKASGKPINWNKDSFRGRISFGLAAMAKETLEKRNIICTLNPAKKTITTLNPSAVTAANFEEAEEMIQNRIPVLVTHKVDDQPTYVPHRASSFAPIAPDVIDRLLKVNDESLPTSTKIKRPVKPIVYTIMFVIGAAIAGGLITYLLGLLI